MFCEFNQEFCTLQWITIEMSSSKTHIHAIWLRWNDRGRVRWHLMFHTGNLSQCSMCVYCVYMGRKILIWSLLNIRGRHLMVNSKISMNTDFNFISIVQHIRRILIENKQKFFCFAQVQCSVLFRLKWISWYFIGTLRVCECV